jgi:hypothetical protein
LPSPAGEIREQRLQGVGIDGLGQRVIETGGP